MTTTNQATTEPKDFEVTIATKLEARSKSLLSTFLELDHDKTGHLHPEEFSIALHNLLGIDLTEDQLHVIFSRFNVNNNQKPEGIRYADFVRYISNTAHYTATSSSLIGAHHIHTNSNTKERRIEVPQSAKTEELQLVLRRKVRSRYSSRQSGRGRNAQMYLMMDTGRDGKVTMAEFQAWTASVGLELSEEQCRAVLGEHYWSDATKGIDLREFVRFLDDLDDATVWWSHNNNKYDDEESDGMMIADDEADGHLIDALHTCIEEGNHDRGATGTCEEKDKDALVQEFRDFDDSDASASAILASLLSKSLGMKHDCAESIVGEWSGKLSKVEFVRLVAARLDRSERRHGLKSNKDEDNAILMSRHNPTKGSENGLSSNNESNLSNAEKAAISQFREALDVRQLLARRAFEKMDTNLTRDIDVDELCSGFREFGIEMSLPQAKRVIDHFDLNRNGRLSYASFIRLLTEKDL